MKVELINPHGFCAGVKGALDKAHALALSHKKVYCLHEIVHNEIVVADLCRKGFVFVESLDDVPEGETVLFSAHGVSPQVRQQALKRQLKVVDATCPFVTRVHKAARRYYEADMPVVIIGKGSHAEVKGIIGEAPEAFVISDISQARAFELPQNFNGKIGVVSQTTMNSDEVAKIVEELCARYQVETSAEVCNATKERQEAVKAFAGDAVLVLGSQNSSNTRRLCEVAACKTFRAANIEEVRAIDFSGIKRLGVTSGASTPEKFYDEAVEFLLSYMS